MSTSTQDQFSISDSELGRLDKLYIVEQSSNSDSPPPIHAAPFDKLATEIIQEIFTLASPDVLFGYQGTSVPFHFELGLVCKKWSGIVGGHHSLWATFKIYTDRLNSPIFTTKLRDYLQKSGTHPLKIHICGSKVPSEILDTIILQSERWNTIKLDTPLKYDLLEKLELVRDRIPLLQRLRIRGPLDQYSIEKQFLPIFRNAPMLNRISVENMDRDTALTLALPCARVSRARLDSSSFRELQSTFQQSQTLTTLTLFGEFYYTSREPVCKTPVTLEKLQVLRVRGGVDVSYLTCPSLQWLEVSDESLLAIQTFLNKSSCALKHLKLENIYADNDYNGPSIDILQHISLAGLTYLHIEDDCFSLNLSDILYKKSFPFLETLSVEIDFYPLASSFYTNMNFKKQIQTLQRIVESRTHSCHRGTVPISSYAIGTVEKPLRECYFTFSRDEPWRKWQEKKLQCLRSFCDSRNATVVLRKFGIEAHTQDEVEQNIDICNTKRCSHIDNGDYYEY